MHGRADVLGDRVAEDVDLAGVGIDLDIDDVDAEGGAGAAGDDAAATLERSTRLHLLARQLGEGHRLLAVGGVPERAVGVLDLLGLALPELGRAGDHLLLDVEAGLVHGLAAGVSRARAAGHVVVADGVGVDDGGADAVVLDAEGLGKLHGQRGARAADVRSSPR